MKNKKTPEIKHGEKTIKLKIAFFTDGLKNPLMVWENGAVYVMTNRSRGIRINENPAHFKNLNGIVPAVIKKLEEFGIEVVRKEGGKVVVVEKDKFIHRRKND